MLMGVSDIIIVGWYSVVDMVVVVLGFSIIIFVMSFI